MRHGEMLWVLKDGIRVEPEAIRPLGVEDGAICWGLWISGQRTKKLAKNDQKQIPHLVVSPIHPDYWASVFHLEMKLVAECGALASALDTLQKCHVNILTHDCGRAGYRHEILNVLCSIEQVRQRLQLVLDQKPPQVDAQQSASSGTPSNDAERENKLKSIGLTMLLSLAELWAQLRIEENQKFKQAGDAPGDQTPAFLYSPVLEFGQTPWYIRSKLLDDIAQAMKDPDCNAEQLGALLDGVSPLDAFDVRNFKKTMQKICNTLGDLKHTVEGPRLGKPTEEARIVEGIAQNKESFTGNLLRKVWRNHWYEALSIRALQGLAYFRVWAYDPTPVSLQYDASQSMLRWDGFDDVSPIRRHDKAFEFPTRAVASFHRLDRYVRIRFLNQWHVESRLAEVKVKFEATRANGESSDTSPSANGYGKTGVTEGLLYSVSRVLASNNYNILRAGNHLTKLTPSVEHGEIEFVGEVSAEQRLDTWRSATKKHLEKELAAFRSRQTSESTNWDRLDVEVTPARTKRLFLSYQHQAVERDLLKSIVEEAARGRGFKVVFGEAGKSGTTKHRDSVSDHVVDIMRGCDAVLQIASLRKSEALAVDRHLTGKDSEEESRKPGIEANFDWLHLEYACAKSMNKPRERIIDEQIPEEARKRVCAMDRDKHKYLYDSKKTKQTLTVSVNDAVKKLFDEVQR